MSVFLYMGGTVLTCYSPSAVADVIDFDFDCLVSVLTGCEESNKLQRAPALKGSNMREILSYLPLL